MKKRDSLSKIEELLVLLTPITIVSHMYQERYVLVSEEATLLEQLSDGSYLRPFRISSYKNIGGIKRVYRKYTERFVTKRICGISIKWFNKILKVEDQIVFKPLKQHWNKNELSYKFGGKESDPFMNVWFVLNQDYSNIYKEQHQLELIEQIDTAPIINFFNKRIQTFHIKHKI